MPGHDAPAIAASQAGVFTRAQAREAGRTTHQIHHLVRTHRWRPVGGMALTAQPAVSPVALAWAVELTSPGAVASHWTAAHLHDLLVPPGTDGRLHALRAGRRSWKGLQAHTAPLDDAEVRRLGRGGPRVTDRRRTAIDCLALCTPSSALDLYAWLRTRQVLDRGMLAEEVRRRTGWTGTPVLLHVLAATRDDALSRAEALMHRILRRHRITGWRANVRVVLPDGSWWVVDLLFERARVAVEVDGWGAHGSRQAFLRDRRRSNALTAAGWTVLRFPYDDLRDRPDEVARLIRAALRP